MKYSIRGNFTLEKQEVVTTTVAAYPLWKPFEPKNTENSLVFEVFLNASSDKESLFNDLKPLVTEEDEVIDWHECTHDENIPKPCAIVEEYRK